MPNSFVLCPVRVSVAVLTSYLCCRSVKWWWRQWRTSIPFTTLRYSRLIKSCVGLSAVILLLCPMTMISILVLDLLTETHLSGSDQSWGHRAVSHFHTVTFSNRRARLVIKYTGKCSCFEGLLSKLTSHYIYVHSLVRLHNRLRGLTGLLSI